MPFRTRQPIEGWRCEVRYRRASHKLGPIPLMVNPVKRSVGRLCTSVTIPSQRERLLSHQQIALQMLETRFPVPRTSSPRRDPRLGKNPPPEELMIRKAPSKIPPLSARTERTAQAASARLLMLLTIQRMRDQGSINYIETASHRWLSWGWLPLRHAGLLFAPRQTRNLSIFSSTIN